MRRLALNAPHTLLVPGVVPMPPPPSVREILHQYENHNSAEFLAAMPLGCRATWSDGAAALMANTGLTASLRLDYAIACTGRFSPSDWGGSSHLRSGGFRSMLASLAILVSESDDEVDLHYSDGSTVTIGIAKKAPFRVSHVRAAGVGAVGYHGTAGNANQVDNLSAYFVAASGARNSFEYLASAKSFSITLDSNGQGSVGYQGNNDSSVSIFSQSGYDYPDFNAFIVASLPTDMDVSLAMFGASL